MTSQILCLRNLSDRDLLSEVHRAVIHERQATARLIALLMEVDERKLYAQQSCSSLFTYCVQVLHFSEHAAYLRIEAARAARRFPVILDKLSEGALHLSGVSLLAPHLTVGNYAEILDAARHKSKRDIQQLIANLRPQPDAPSVIRKLPVATSAVNQTSVSPASVCTIDQPVCTIDQPMTGAAQTALASIGATLVRPPEITPLAPERYKVQFTVSHETHAKLRRVQDLMRHIIPNGDPAPIFDRALTALLAELSRSKCAATDRPRPSREATHGSRHVPAAVKREVWRRDGDRCTFHGEQGRCRETGFLELHHVVPFAEGGPTTTENLELRCRAHNAYEAEKQFRRSALPLLVRETRAAYDSARTRSRPSSRKFSAARNISAKLKSNFR